MKTLEQAIGCWTVNPNYNSLVCMARHISESTRHCRHKTLRNNPSALAAELRVLRGRLEAMIETTNDAIKRCAEIINTNELESSHDHR